MSILSTGLRSATGCFTHESPVVYVSPSIRYAAHPRYAKIVKAGDGQWMQVILQVRVDPSLISIPARGKESVTIGKKSKFNDSNMPASYDAVEWLIKPPSGHIRQDQAGQKFKRGVSNIRMRDGIVVYGILMRKWREGELPLDSDWW